MKSDMRIISPKGKRIPNYGQREDTEPRSSKKKKKNKRLKSNEKII